MGIAEDIMRFLIKSDSLLVVGSTLTAVLIWLSMKFSWLTPSKKERLVDEVDGAKTDLVTGLHSSYERQFELLTARVESMDTRILAMNDTIHRQQIRLTRLQVLVIQMNGLLQSKGVDIPEFIKVEISQLLENDK